MARLFVYGTLKGGQPNHYCMLDKSIGAAQLLATAVTTEKFPLVIAGEYNIPFLLNLPGQGHRVHGELYRVDERLLNFLDVLEDIPATYQRTLVMLTVEEWLGQADHEERSAAGGVTEAFVYSTTTYQLDWPSLPHYESYDSRGHHGLEYIRK
ncbi:gamma-glutamylaminecyclotransferase-like [Phyllopteryx taeniolatus]|uniref:gamma-glutamylaminecyclotransferase-like n=1 Tax=Phyllopteryx taeniolatus TaxID=161469 RepID=UPI002AD557B0|nr:gamma-glutamylaminecyclotransferase-like [Phyllopteryx taeniolatus]XP_061620900.1 gamma-glutamylaminecyclotransferase-like [Phyllopteryx taeniolatus]